MNHFRIKLVGKTYWLDIYKTDMNLSDPRSLLDENLNPIGEEVEDEGDLIFDLKEASKEAVKQFHGRDWDLSNGEDLVSKRGTKKTRGKAPEGIFGAGKPAIPNYRVKVVRRDFNGSLFTKKVSPSEKPFGKFDKNLIAMSVSLKTLDNNQGSTTLPLN